MSFDPLDQPQERRPRRGGPAERRAHRLRARAGVEPALAPLSDPWMHTPTRGADTVAAAYREQTSRRPVLPGEVVRPSQGRDPVCQLEREWLVLEQGAVAAALPGWRERQAPLRRFDSGRRLRSFLNSACPEETDAPLLALLWLAREERLAGRFVLQAILPALKSQAERIAHEPGRREELWELLLFFAWEAICCYPVERRRFRVAANLVLQVLHDTTRELRQPQLHPIAATPRSRARTGALLGLPAAESEALRQPDAGPTTTVERLGAEALVRSAVTAGLIAERDAQLILQTRVDGVSLRLIARVLRVSYHALRQRRQRAERRLRELLGASRDVSKAGDSDLISSAGSASPHRRSEPAVAQPDPASRPAA